MMIHNLPTSCTVGNLHARPFIRLAMALIVADGGSVTVGGLCGLPFELCILSAGGK